LVMLELKVARGGWTGQGVTTYYVTCLLKYV
jgi:hypothetical protein